MIQLYGLYDRRAGMNSAPFYVGITSVERMYRHTGAAKTGKHWNKYVQQVFDEHFAEGIEPEYKTLCVCPDKEYAGAIERGMIKAYGRKIDGGILCNIAQGGEGPDSELMSRPDMREKNRLAQIRSYARIPERREKARRAAKEINSRPEVKASKSAKTKELNARLWADPEHRAKRIAGIRGKKKTMSEVSLAARRANALKAVAARAFRKATAAKEENNPVAVDKGASAHG